MPTDPLFHIAGVQASLRRLSDTLDAANRALFHNPDIDAAYLFDSAALGELFSTLSTDSAAMLRSLEGSAETP